MLKYTSFFVSLTANGKCLKSYTLHYGNRLKSLVGEPKVKINNTPHLLEDELLDTY